MINEEISKEAGQAAQTIISYTIKAAKESINLDKEIRKKINDTLEKANGNLKSLMGDEMKIKDLYKKGQLENITIDQSDLKDLKKELNKLGVSFSVMKNKESQNYEIFFQAKDIKVMEYAFKQVIAKENKKEKESILKQIKKYKDLFKNKDKTKEKVKRKVKEKINNDNFETIIFNKKFRLLKERMKLIEEQDDKKTYFFNRTLTDEEIEEIGENIDGSEVWERYVDILKEENYAKKIVELSKIREKMMYFLYEVKKNTELNYSDIKGSIIYIDDGDKYFTDGVYTGGEGDMFI